MTDSILGFFEAWYESHCDGDWEHDIGVRIGTLDNPGWSLLVNLNGTRCEGRVADGVEIDRSDTDWLYWWSDGQQFEAAAGPKNLAEACEAFRTFASPGGAAGGHDDVSG